MTDDPPLTGQLIESVQSLARRALDRSDTNAAALQVLSTKFDVSERLLAGIIMKVETHLDWCSRESQSNRTETSEWRKLLGERLDRMEEAHHNISSLLLKWVLTAIGGILLILLSIIGFLADHLIMLH